MYHLYILKSGVKNWHYIGTTEDLHNRLAEHNAGEVKSTKAYKPFKMVYVEGFSSKTEARKREIFLKKNSRARRDIISQIMVPSSSLA
ncbi:MAG: GIY-YIG nuclease family protein [Patescibacteria group bacterium]|nr:GIY-YIG nuclease family protein [Patescibacteria group bacterium]